MARNYQQTSTQTGGDTGTVQCSGVTQAAVVLDYRKILEGGVAGGNVTVTAPGYVKAPILARGCHFFTAANDPNDTSWAAGNWVIRLNVQTANANMTWVRTYVCRVNSALVSQATVGSLLAQTTSLATTGVKTHTVVGAAQTAAAGDRIYIVCIFQAGAATDQSVVFTMDQLIDAPLTAIVTGGPFPHYTRRRLLAGMIGMGA